jgi:FkbH-like protein
VERWRIRYDTGGSRKASSSDPPGFRPIRIHLYADETLDFLAEALFACGLRHGLLIEATCHRFDEAVATALEGQSPLASADFAVLLAPVSELGGPDSAARLLQGVSALVEAHPKSRCVLATLPRAIEEGKNSADLLIEGSARSERTAYNAALVADCLKRRALLWDLDGLASRIGSAQWFDARLQHHAKIPFSLDVTLAAADDLATVIAAASGTTRRLLVLDLDNTLWGGVIGDDGLNGIVIGQGSAAGESYLAVQRTALALRARGVALAVCSKNDEANAREPFQKHPDMLLREDHIAVFTANWTDKATNIRAIAETLNLGLQSVAFLDDNPAERERVRQVLPEVAVIEVGDDASAYAPLLLASGYFEHLPPTDEDRARASDYQANAERSVLMSRAESYEDYLMSLGMELIWAPFDAVGRARIAQLANRSNQFNLTTQRYSEADIEAIETSGTRSGFQVRLKDRFADNGMIAILVIDRTLQNGAKAWSIDTWLMSCRVLKRGVEHAVLNILADLARNDGATSLIGTYIPTAKNGVVATHYADLGFAAAGALEDHPATEDGRTASQWVMSLDAFSPKPIYLAVEQTGAGA